MKVSRVSFENASRISFENACRGPPKTAGRDFVRERGQIVGTR